MPAPAQKQPGTDHNCQPDCRVEHISEAAAEDDGRGAHRHGAKSVSDSPGSVSSDRYHCCLKTKEHGHCEHAWHQKLKVATPLWCLNRPAKEPSEHEHNHDRKEPPQDHDPRLEAPM